MDRRSFIGALGATALGGLTAAAAGCAGAAESGHAGSAGPGDDRRSTALGLLGLQLYTVRREMARDLEATLARVAQIGYREVEFAGYFGRSASSVRATLERAGLAAPATHVSLDSLETEWDATIEDAGTVGHRYVIVPYLPEERRRTLNDYRRIAQQFNTLGARLQGTELAFAYHNHDFEFAPLEGRIPFDILLAETDPALVEFELDLYWIAKGGQDPLDYFARHPGRFPLVHVKDSAGPPDHRMVDVGSGTIDWQRLLIGAREQAGIRHMFVEHDNPPNAFESIAASLRYLSALEPAAAQPRQRDST